MLRSSTGSWHLPITRPVAPSRSFGVPRRTTLLSAEARHSDLYRRWRSRIRLGVLLGILAVAIVLGALAMVWPREAQFFLGLVAGGSLSMLMLVGLAAPEHVDRWRVGLR